MYCLLNEDTFQRLVARGFYTPDGGGLVAGLKGSDSLDEECANSELKPRGLLVGV